VKLARQPGQSASRYAHLLCGPVDTGAAPAPETPAAVPADNDRLAAIENEIVALRAELEQVKQRLGMTPPPSEPPVQDQAESGV
jgi:uncharacterized protein